MKLMIWMFLLVCPAMAFSQTEVESENVDSLTLEAPAEETLPSRSEENEMLLNAIRGTASEENYDEAQKTEKTAKELMAEQPAEAQPVPQPQATTEEILRQKGMIKPPKESKPVGHKQMVDFGKVSGVQKYKITCTLNDDVREITALVQDDGSVGVIHKKFGVEKTAVISKDPAYADQIAEKIHYNLANNKYPYTCVRE